MNTEEELGQLEEAIRQRASDGISARWEFGSRMLALRAGKQLPRGVLDAHCKTYGVSRSELSARMKFAAAHPADQVSTVVETHRTWTNIKKTFTRKPRAQQPKRDGVWRLLDRFENVDFAPLTPVQRDKIAERLRKMITRIDSQDSLRCDSADVTLIDVRQLRHTA